MLGNILESLGLYFPGQHIVGDEHNPDGYFEWREVVDLQEQLLVDLDRWWPSYKGTYPLPDDWLTDPATLKVKQQLISLLHNHVNQKNNLYAIKDPRTSRLLPLWNLIASQISINIRVILAVRDPSEVVASLLRRDSAITGMTSVRAQQIWYLHNKEVIENTISFCPLSTIHYGDWFNTPQQQLRSLINFIPNFEPSQEKLDKALSLIRKDLRRSYPSRKGVRRTVKLFYDQLLSNQNPEDFNLSSSNTKYLFKPDSSFPPNCHTLVRSPRSWSAWQNAWEHHQAPRYSADLLCESCQSITLIGSSLLEWETHLYINRLPIQDLANHIQLEEGNLYKLIFSPNSKETNYLERKLKIAINLTLPIPDKIPEWFINLKRYEIIFDPLPSRVYLLRALGLNAFWLSYHSPDNGWLSQFIQRNNYAWSEYLGLPNATSHSILVLGRLGNEWDLELTKEAEEIGNKQTLPIVYMPGWFELSIVNTTYAIAKAAWFEDALTKSNTINLVLPDGKQLSPLLRFLRLENIRLLSAKSQPTPSELRADLLGKNFRALSEQRPSPPIVEIYNWSNNKKPEVSVLVSLYNYQDKIIQALDSVARQTQKNLELIVIDDCSLDSSAEIVYAWMNQRTHPFVSLKLFKHDTNSGLSVTRNTAFSLANSNWCFVLDADNYLMENAIQSCYSLTDKAPDSLAVVHPLIAVKSELGRIDDTRTLVGGESWQSERFIRGNFVDAMALVRRSAWSAVEGYTHIEGGWEDYDFWCKLVEKGFYGVQCPFIHAIYRSHTLSMSHLATNRSLKALSMVLEDRHEWLSLKY